MRRHDFIHCPRHAVLVLAGAAAMLAGCASTPSATYTHPAYGSTLVYRIVNTGSFGNGTIDVPLRIEQARYEGQDVMRVSLPSGAATLHDPATANTIAALDAQGRVSMRYDPPLGVRWPLELGRSETQSMKLSVAGAPAVPMTATWTVAAVEDVTVPAGTFKAWRLTMSDNFGFRQTTWSVPDRIGMFARRESVRPAGHPQGEGTQTMQLVSAPPR